MEFDWEVFLRQFERNNIHSLLLARALLNLNERVSSIEGSVLLIQDSMKIVRNILEQLNNRTYGSGRIG